MTTTDWIQAISMIVLVIVTGVYAWRTHAISKATKEQAEATRQQAEASIKMAEEMKNQRYDAVLPIIDIFMQGDPIRRIGEQMSNESDLEAAGLSCRLKNIGVGKAIDFFSFIINPQTNEHFQKDFGTLAVDEETPQMIFALERDESGLAIVAHYKDIYGRSFKSKRYLIGENENWGLGQLKTFLL